jgi:hypothetical protein
LDVVVARAPFSAIFDDYTFPLGHFEVDPARWLSLGHNIIDGGPTRLPRTFYNRSVNPHVRHGNILVAVLEPAPPAADEGAWRDHVRDFIQQHHQRAVESFQPCLFGIGLYELRSAAAVNALLQQDLFEIGACVFVRFVTHNDQQNHRAV